MKTLFDTSVLVAAVVEPHPMHVRALPWLQRAKAGEIDFFVASHTLAELYAVLTTLPLYNNAANPAVTAPVEATKYIAHLAAALNPSIML